jgi:hypothetical protein
MLSQDSVLADEEFDITMGHILDNGVFSNIPYVVFSAVTLFLLFLRSIK